MIFAQFFQRDLLGDLVEGLGDRSVVILDGRNTHKNQKECAAEHGRKYAYEAFEIRKGRFNNYVTVSKQEKL